MEFCALGDTLNPTAESDQNLWSFLSSCGSCQKIFEEELGEVSLHPVHFLRRPDVSRLEQDDQQQQHVLVAVLGPVAHLALDLDEPVQAVKVCLGEVEKIKIREGVSLQLFSVNPVVQQLSSQFFHFFLAQ